MRLRDTFTAQQIGVASVPQTARVHGLSAERVRTGSAISENQCAGFSIPLPTTILAQYISVLTAALVFARELFEEKEAREAVFPP